MKLLLVCLLLPAVAFARMGINVSGNDSDMKVSVTGSNVNIITDDDRNSFKMSDSKLQQGSEKYFGQWPNDVYVRSPTPWGDLYSTYSDIYNQVQRTLKPVSGKVLSISSRPEIVKKADFTNESSKKGTFNAGISQEVEKSFSSTWSQSSSLTVGETIEFEFNIEVGKATSKTSFSATCEYGKSDSKTETVTVGDTNGVMVELEPGESVHAELQADRGTMQIEVNYEATLSGHVCVNYDSPYKGHHFWGLDINAVMSGAGLPTKITAKQIVNVGFYTNSKIILKDQPNGKTLKTVPVKIGL